jgi:integrase/recombinase XerD
MMTNRYEKSIHALQLNGKGERTQEAYTRAVRMLVEFYHQTPDLITEEELQHYFLHRRNVDRWSPATLRICYSGIRFFFEQVLHRDWPTLKLIHAQRETHLPIVLSREEVPRLLSCVRTPHNSAFLATVYACGLRWQEAQPLEVADIDSRQMRRHIHRGQGVKDRLVPRPHSTLLLRKHGASHRNPRLLFPAIGRDAKSARSTQHPMARSSVQGAFRRAKFAAQTQQHEASVHALHHSYATPLLEAGVNIRTSQRYLGHSTLETTMIYLHMTQAGPENASALINGVMEGL